MSPYPVLAWAQRQKRMLASPVGSDRSLFAETLDECHVRSGFRIWRWLLKGDRARLFVGTPSVHPVAGKASLQNLHRRRLLAVHPPQQSRFGDRHPSTRFESDPASAIGNRSPTTFPDPVSDPGFRFVIAAGRNKRFSIGLNRAKRREWALFLKNPLASPGAIATVSGAGRHSCGGIFG